MEHVSAFLPAIFAGLGLFLAGAANLLLVRRSFEVRAGATILALGTALVIAARFEPARILLDTAIYLALAMIAFALLTSSRLHRAVNAGLAAARRPAVSAALLTAAGIGLAIGSVATYERADDRAIDLARAELDLLHSAPPTAPSLRERAATDRGTVIALQERTAPRDREYLTEAEARTFSRGGFKESVIRAGPADDRSNCHGWIFTGGRYLVLGTDVEVILKENDYREEVEPRVGDLVVYRSPTGSIVHTAVVQYTADGEPVLVRGKWGNLGIFTHVVDKSPYGSDFGYYRSPRPGHLLVISPTPAASPVSSGETTPSVE